jgi:hypothetical protein
VAVATAATPSPVDANAGSGLRITGIVVGAVGAAALASGVILNLRANSMASDLEKPESYSRSTDSSRKDWKTLAWVDYGAGAGPLVAGGVLYYLGWNRGRADSSTLAVTPVLSSDTIGTAVTGAF